MLANLIRMRCSLDHLGSPLILCGSCLNEKYRKELKVPLKKKKKSQPKSHSADFSALFWMVTDFMWGLLWRFGERLPSHNVRGLNCCLYIGAGSAPGGVRQELVEGWQQCGSAEKADSRFAAGRCPLHAGAMQWPIQHIKESLLTHCVRISFLVQSHTEIWQHCDIHSL